MPGSTELSWGPLSPNACWGLSCWCWVSWRIGFSTWQPTATALLYWWPGEPGELTPSSLLPEGPGSCCLLSLVLTGGGSR